MQLSGLFLMVVAGCAPLAPYPLHQQQVIPFTRGDGMRLVEVCPVDGKVMPLGCQYAPHGAVVPRSWPVIQPRGRMVPICFVCGDWPRKEGRNDETP